MFGAWGLGLWVQGLGSGFRAKAPSKSNKIFLGCLPQKKSYALFQEASDPTLAECPRPRRNIADDMIRRQDAKHGNYARCRPIQNRTKKLLRGVIGT